jgi:Ca2+/Na+ antiporter
MSCILEKYCKLMTNLFTVKHTIFMLAICIMRFKVDFLHCALLVLVVLLAVYVARGSGLFREGVGHKSHKKHPVDRDCETSPFDIGYFEGGGCV